MLQRLPVCMTSDPLHNVWNNFLFHYALFPLKLCNCARKDNAAKCSLKEMGITINGDFLFLDWFVHFLLFFFGDIVYLAIEISLLNCWIHPRLKGISAFTAIFIVSLLLRGMVAFREMWFFFSIGVCSLNVA